MRARFSSLQDYLHRSNAVGRALRAVAVGAGVWVVLIFVLKVGILADLPGYLAVALGFLIAILLPGLFLQWALLSADEVDPVGRVAMAFALGLAVAAPPGVISLWLNLDLQTFTLLYIALAALVSAAATLLYRDSAGDEPATLRGSPSAWVPLLILLAIGVAWILAGPIWAAGDISRDFDSWTYMAYVNQYVTGDPMTPLEPLGVGETGTPRMSSNVWLVVQAMITEAADVQPHDVLMEYLPPLLPMFAIAATYALAMVLFRNRTLATMAAAIQLGYAFISLSPHEGFGRDLLVRSSEGKITATFVLMPLGLLVASRLFNRSDPRLYAAYWLIVLAVFSVHPIPLSSMALIVAAVAVVRAGVQRSRRPLHVGGWLVLPVVTFAAVHLIQWQLLARSPGLFSYVEVFRDAFKYTTLPGGLIIGSYHLLLHPLMLGAIVLAPLVWWIGRDRVGNQLVFATTVAVLVWYFVPPLSTLLSKFMASASLWRLHWAIPVPLTLAFVSHEALSHLKQRRGAASRREEHPVPAPALGPWLPAFSVLVLLAAALLVQESYVRLDGGAFYDYTSSSSLLPFTDKSIFVGGIDRLYSGRGRLREHVAELIDFMDADLPEGSVVLAPVTDVSQFIPGTTRAIKPLDFRLVSFGDDRRTFVTDFYEGRLTGPELDSGLRRFGVDFVVVRKGSTQETMLDSLGTAQPIAGFPVFELYGIGSP